MEKVSTRKSQRPQVPQEVGDKRHHQLVAEVPQGRHEELDLIEGVCQISSPCSLMSQGSIEAQK